MAMDIESLQMKLREFARERKWEKYHNPKNLSMALTKEAAELAEIFQWLSEKESKEIKNFPQKMEEIRDEMADVFSYLLRLSDILDVDLQQSLLSKMKKNEAKYPVNSEKLTSFLLK